MSRVAIWAQLEARPGKEKEIEEFLKSAQPLAVLEPDTLSWYAVKLGPGKYGIFDTFADERGRNAHLNGEIAKALFAKAGDLLAKPPEISKPEILAVKSAVMGSISEQVHVTVLRCFKRKLGFCTPRAYFSRTGYP